MKRPFQTCLILQVRIPMPDILAAIEDISASPVAEGISNGGYVDLDPATITPEGMHLLQACFVNRELKMAEDKVRSKTTSGKQIPLLSLDVC